MILLSNDEDKKAFLRSLSLSANGPQHYYLYLCAGWHNRLLLITTDREAKYREGYVFTSVCHSVHRGVGIWSGESCQRGVAHFSAEFPIFEKMGDPLYENTINVQLVQILLEYILVLLVFFCFSVHRVCVYPIIQLGRECGIEGSVCLYTE